MDRKFSLSDSDLDSIDGLKTKFDTLQNHSHFFSSTVSHAQSFPELIADGQPNIVIEESKELEPIFSFDNRLGLAHDLSFLAGLPELCDVTFLVGEDRQPVCGVKAILAARSKVFRRQLYGESTSSLSKKTKKKALYRPNSDGYVEKTDFRGQPTITVLEFEPEVFKQLMEYIHTGSVVLQSRTLLGLMNAADHYGLDELKTACIQFLDRAINTDTVNALLSSAEKYIQYKSTKILVQKMLEFVDQHAEVVLNLGSFSTLPQHVVRIILGREELMASEETKFESAFRWCLRYLDDHPDVDLKSAFEPFVCKIAFHKISATHLMKKIKPAGIVDNTVILNALAYQANPTLSDEPPVKPTSKKMTTSASIPVLESSPPQIRRVCSSTTPLKINISSGSEDEAVESRNSRGNSVPPSGLDNNPLDCPAEVFQVRADSQASELSLSSMTGSTTSLSSTPQSPNINRSTSTSSYLNNLSPHETEGRKQTSRTESYVTLSSTSVEV